MDIALAGSTSIKKVLPVLALDLTHNGMALASGTNAMQSWKRLIVLADSEEKDNLRSAMLAYCKFNTYAMVRIYKVMERF